MKKLSEYQKIIKPFLSQKRYEHSICVAKEAAFLAKKYGVDVEKAQIAGILHDIMKDTSSDDQLKTITEFGIILNDIELSSKKLWHQIAGAAYCKGALGIDDEDIINAIRYHTSGRKNMSKLEKVLFIADYTSSDRDYKGVDDMRRYALISLEKAMVEGISYTLIELAEGRKLIISDTIDAYNEAVQTQP